jgi:hypothetical protein
VQLVIEALEGPSASALEVRLHRCRREAVTLQPQYHKVYVSHSIWPSDQLELVMIGPVRILRRPREAGAIGSTIDARQYCRLAMAVLNCIQGS